jgi:4-diphosphocytidyl-2-C-methyl-D-erythritol kinase
METTEVTLSAPAKVNLFLKILGKRDDGYHEIYSLFQPISLSDEITIRVKINKGGVRLTTDSPALPTGEANIALRAARLFLSEAGLEGGSVEIDIKKRIPIGAGLGGGSTDAAAVLMGLNALFNAPFDEDALMKLGAELGSDVPFFMLKGPAIARGRGEVLERVTLPKFGYVLINPGYEVSTAWAYSALDSPRLDLTKPPKNINFMYSAEPQSRLEETVNLLANDLEAVTARKHPEIDLYKRELLNAGARGALMSGSGPTVFGLFDDVSSARPAYGLIKKRVKTPASVFLATGL